MYFCLFFFLKEHKKNKPENKEIGYFQEGGEWGTWGRDMRASDTAVSKPCYRVSPVRKWANGLHIKKNNNKINKKLHKNWMQMETDEPNCISNE